MRVNHFMKMTLHVIKTEANIMANNSDSKYPVYLVQISDKVELNNGNCFQFLSQGFKIGS